MLFTRRARGGFADQDELEITRPGRMDTLTVFVEARDGADTAARAAAAKRLKERIKTLIGISTQVSVADPGSIERSLGKAKRIRDLRK